MKRLPGIISIVLLTAAALAAGCKSENSTSASAARVRHETMVIPSGTSVVASLGTRLTTDTNHTGDVFLATTIDPIVVDGKTVVPAGARIHGVLRDVVASGRTNGRAQMTLAFEQIEDSGGKAYDISAQPLTLQAASETSNDVAKIAAGGALGAIIGGIAGGGKGAVIGAGAGAGAGTVLMLATKGDEVELDQGQRLNVHMTSPTSIVIVALR
jgi:hypothetical protein